MKFVSLDLELDLELILSLGLPGTKKLPLNKIKISHFFEFLLLFFIVFPSIFNFFHKTTCFLESLFYYLSNNVLKPMGNEGNIIAKHRLEAMCC